LGGGPVSARAPAFLYEPATDGRQRTNRAAIGARIKATAAGPKPLTVHRHVTSGSSFGANTLEQTIGLGDASAAATVEVYWPTSKTTQTFHDVPAGRVIEITEFDDDYRIIALTKANSDSKAP
jgi:hypothetical protein